MIDNNILWARAIDPMSGRLTKQHTFLSAALIIAGLVIVFAAFAAFLFIALA